MLTRQKALAACSGVVGTAYALNMTNKNNGKHFLSDGDISAIHFQKLVTEVGLIAHEAGLLEESLHNVSLHSSNEAGLALVMWLERLNMGNVRLHPDMVAEILEWLDPSVTDDDQDIVDLFTENQLLTSEPAPDRREEALIALNEWVAGWNKRWG